MRRAGRNAAIAVTAASAIAFLVAGGISVLAYPAARDVAPAGDTAPVNDEIVVHASPGETGTASNTPETSGQTALAVLATLKVKGRAPKTGYDRDEFGQRWLDIDRNGCDTRNDILARDLSDVELSGRCTVMTGTLADPFTGESIAFERGQDTSALVQIDHVVALSDAWQKGAQQLTADQRSTFANDPLNLLAVAGHANAQKGDGDAATWLPKNKAFRCEYVARQVSVKATYGLWVTQAEHDAIAGALLRVRVPGDGEQVERVVREGRALVCCELLRALLPGVGEGDDVVDLYQRRRLTSPLERNALAGERVVECPRHDLAAA